MSAYIYRIKNHITNQCYIGKTELSVQKRFQRHKSNALRGDDTYLYRSMRKYGIDNFTVEIIETTTKEYVDLRESYYIQSTHPELNMTSGGDGGSTTHNRIWVNNGTDNLYLIESLPIPEGFKKGRICKFNDSNFQREMCNRAHFKIDYTKVKQSMINNKVNCKPLVIEGVNYYSRKHAMEILGLTKYQLYKIINANSND